MKIVTAIVLKTDPITMKFYTYHGNCAALLCEKLIVV